MRVLRSALSNQNGLRPVKLVRALALTLHFSTEGRERFRAFDAKHSE